jgi:hypothetical protein
MNAVTTQTQDATLDELREMVAEVRDLLLKQKLVKEYYGVGEVAERFQKAEFTVRQWCRLGRINAEKRMTGRGRSTEWVIRHAELMRIEKEGLLPLSLKG